MSEVRLIKEIQNEIFTILTINEKQGLLFIKKVTQRAYTNTNLYYLFGKI